MAAVIFLQDEAGWNQATAGQPRVVRHHLVVSMGKWAPGPPTIDHDGEQAVKEGLQPLVPAGDDLVEHLCRKAVGWSWGPHHLQTQPRGHHPHIPGPG